jgi:inosine-uridine nucleoside N-ribohydrolase
MAPFRRRPFPGPATPERSLIHRLISPAPEPQGALALPTRKPLARALAGSLASRPVPRPVIFDSDPGHDDALAHLLALERPELRVLGISTVAGNAPVDRVTDNALRFLTLIDHPTVPVVAGADRNSSGELHTAEYVHGTSGLDGAELPEAIRGPVDIDVSDFHVRLISQSSEPVTLIATGPLTNVAQLLDRHPTACEQIERIVLMGGSVTEGNKTPSAEFNIWADPEAAAAVFCSPVPVTMIGLNVTHQVQVTPADLRRLRGSGGRVSTTIADLLEFFIDWHWRTYGWDSSPLHDAVTVAHLLAPDLFSTEALPVEVELNGTLTRGRTVVDTRRMIDTAGKHCEVAMAVQGRRVVELILDAVIACDQRLASAPG